MNRPARRAKARPRPDQGPAAHCEERQRAPQPLFSSALRFVAFDLRIMRMVIKGHH